MKQCSLSSLAYSTPSLMKTDIALNMKDTKRFMWMKFLHQPSQYPNATPPSCTTVLHHQTPHLNLHRMTMAMVRETREVL
ncbi:hypothetical protein EYF80_025859 [Liparis tanakae]|uniref:Uncharacterized protein n=1 Tax=Liparis tanakae TaxID=230148 RepID=A0A4Z2HDX9_9TELE|nr:hypothetical protein EYF80_025859 [Liparis tanakae]